MKLRHLIYLIGVLIFTFGCDKDVMRLDDFYLEFATVTKSAKGLNFELDDYRILTPEKAPNYTGNEGQRVILNYTPLKDNTIKINSISDIHTGAIQYTDNTDTIPTDMVKVQSVWTAGKYLNMIIEVEYFDIEHSVGIVRNISTPDINLYFTHSTNNDPRGYQKKMYISFSLSPFMNESNIDTPINLFVNTYDGIKKYELLLNHL